MPILKRSDSLPITFYKEWFFDAIQEKHYSVAEIYSHCFLEDDPLDVIEHKKDGRIRVYTAQLYSLLQVFRLVARMHGESDWLPLPPHVLLYLI